MVSVVVRLFVVWLWGLGLIFVICEQSWWVFFFVQGYFLVVIQVFFIFIEDQELNWFNLIEFDLVQEREVFYLLD